MDPVAAQMVLLGVLALLCLLCAGEDVIAGIVFSWPGWWPRAARLMNSWLLTPIGLVDVTSRYGEE